MKVGLIARADDRGLGILSWEWYRHMHPDRVLVVDAEDPNHPTHLDRYPGCQVTPWRGGQFDEAAVRDWITGLDIAYIAETFYDERLPGWFADAKVPLVVHAMPEFFRWGELPWVHWWNPTTWLHGRLPAGSVVMPVPVPTDRWTTVPEPHDGPARILHVAGKRAAGDRNGSAVFTAAIKMTTKPVEVIIATQGTPPRTPIPKDGNVTVRADTGNYWDIYDGADVLVLPRRYGGLSLPVNEAAGAGLGLLLSAQDPNPTNWPCLVAKIKTVTSVRTPAGVVPSGNVDPRHLAAMIDSLADPAQRLHLQREAQEWARTHSWEALRPFVISALADVVGRR